MSVWWLSRREDQHTAETWAGESHGALPFYMPALRSSTFSPAGPETGQARGASWEGFSGPDRRQSTQCLLLPFSVLWHDPECGVTLMPARAVGLVLAHPQSQFQDGSQASTHGLPAGAVFLCTICGATQDQAPNMVLTCWVSVWSVFHRVSSGLWVTRSSSPQAWAHMSPPTLPPPVLRAASGPQHWIAAGAVYAACPSLLAPRDASQALPGPMPHVWQPSGGRPTYPPWGLSRLQLCDISGPSQLCSLCLQWMCEACSPGLTLSHGEECMDMPCIMDMPCSSHCTHRPLAYAPCRIWGKQGCHQP